MDWFPSLFFSYKLNKKNQLKANASRRINRPRSWHLEPFISWEDPYTVRQGNPNLLPEYIQSYEFGYIRQLEKEVFHWKSMVEIPKILEKEYNKFMILMLLLKDL